MCAPASLLGDNYPAMTLCPPDSGSMLNQSLLIQGEVKVAKYPRDWENCWPHAPANGHIAQQILHMGNIWPVLLCQNSSQLFENMYWLSVQVLGWSSSSLTADEDTGLDHSHWPQSYHEFVDGQTWFAVMCLMFNRFSLQISMFSCSELPLGL